MKLEIQSLGKISNASIRLDGITAIVGNNDAGKSTVGKALFTAIDAFHDFDEETEKELGYSLFVVGDGQVVVTALRSSLPQVR